MNFSDELRQLSTEKQQEMEKRAKPHALEKELVTWIVAMIQEECRKQVVQGKNHLEGYIKKDGDNSYYFNDDPSKTCLHTFFVGSFLVGLHSHYIDGRGVEDDRFIADELRCRLALMGLKRSLVFLTYENKVEEITKDKRTLFGTKKLKETIVHERYWKNLFISIDW